MNEVSKYLFNTSFCSKNIQKLMSRFSNICRLFVKIKPPSNYVLVLQNLKAIKKSAVLICKQKLFPVYQGLVPKKSNCSCFSQNNIYLTSNMQKSLLRS